MNRIDSLELWVLGVARKVFLFVAALAVLAVVLGALSVVVSGAYFAVARPSEPVMPPAPPPLPEVTLNDARAVLKGREIAYKPTEYLPEVRDRNALAAADRLQSVYSPPDFDWDDTIDTVCTSQTSYGCLARERRVTKVGVRRWLATFLDVLQDKRFPVEEGVGLGLRLLPAADATERAELAPALIIALRERNEKQAEQDDAHQREVDRLKSDYDSAKMEHRATSAALFMGGLSGIGAGIGLVLSICLMVAVLAIERHLRVSNAAVLQ